MKASVSQDGTNVPVEFNGGGRLQGGVIRARPAWIQQERCRRENRSACEA
jgi:hypothetical protein